MADKSEPLISNDTDSAGGTNTGSEASTEPQHLDAVWRRFGDQLRRRARTRLRQYGLTGQAESMDICNDVMADLARRRGGQAVTADDVLAYILRAIDNQVLDTFRSLARQCRDFRRTEMTPVDDMKVANREVTPSQIALRREVLTRIRSMLTEEDAKAIDLMLENRDWNEIGQALGLKADTARMRVRRALDRVRKDIGFGAEDI
jgi:RNA polymerase sigma factor (sigma-70 family)